MGYTSSDPKKWTDADWELEKAANKKWGDMYENDSREIDNARSAYAHIAEMGGSPIKLKAYLGDFRNSEGKVKDYPFNTNWYGGEDMDNNWGNIDPIKEGFLDEGGRPTNKLLNYAQSTGRPIHLYEGGEWGNRNVDGGVDAIVELDPTDEAFWHKAGDVMRGVTAPKVREATAREKKQLHNLIYFEEPGENEGDENKIMMYDFQNSGNDWFRSDTGIQYKGEVYSNEDHAHLGSNWYEGNFFGHEYRKPMNEGDKGQWIFQTDSNKWTYSAVNEEGSEWYWQEDTGWMYPYIDPNNGNKWMYSNDKKDWAHWDTNKSRDHSEWLWANPTPEQTETYNQVDSIADNARDDTMDKIADRTQQMVDDKLSGVQDRVDDRVDQLQDRVNDKVQDKIQDGTVEFGDLIEVAQQKVEQKVEKVQERKPKCRTVSRGPFEFEVCT
jgi:hypothetical protein